MPVVDLARASRAKSPLVGTKAAYLGELLRAGFDVPDGFVVVAGSGEEDRDIIIQRWRQLSHGPVAVRSSAVAEDLDDASFAGQYESILGVRTAEELVGAIARVRASADSERVHAYMAGHADGPKEGGIAVLVQEQVSAEFAGIAFTANPITGNRAEVVINAVPGLADRLASGEVTPQQLVIRDDGETMSDGNGLDPDQARSVADLARKVEAHFGRPQDIEWAIVNEQVLLLQARPITSLPEHVEPVPIPVEVPEGFWQRDAGHAPQPNSRLYSSMVLPQTNVAGKAWFEEYGFLLDGMEWREIGGWQYIWLRPLGGEERKPPPAFLVPMLRRVVPPLRARVRACVEAMRSDRAGTNLRRWHDEWKPDLRSRAEALRSPVLNDISDDQLLQHLDRVSELIGDAMRIHFVLHGAGFLYLAGLAAVGRELLGWDDAETLELLSGLSGTSTEPAAKLSELAQQARDDPVLRGVFTTQELPDLDELSDLAPSFGADLSQYLNEYGYRALRYELMDRSLAENPDLVIQILRDQVVAEFDPDTNLARVRERAGERLEMARRILGNRPTDLARFETALDRARTAYPVREDSEFFTVSVPLGLARLTALELGARLADRGQIVERDDVFYLDTSHVGELLDSGKTARDTVLKHKGERVWALNHAGPATFGEDPGPPPSFAGFPEEVKKAMGALLWAVERTFETSLSGRVQADAERIDGIAAAPGKYTGTARKVMDETQFDRIRAGDVLVCPITSPVWSVLFASVGALVTDTGGILSHPAIIAREYQIPAVVATGNATTLIEDGAQVTVDGTNGVVEVG
ncbi:MAG: PEP/pyruvate-binding domain-containing protein [Acidimicrobiia bacterium]